MALNKEFKNKSPAAIPTVIGLETISKVLQFVVCILFAFRYTDGYSDSSLGNLVNNYDILLVISSVLISVVALILLLGLAFFSYKKLKPIGLLLGGVLVATCVQVGMGFIISANFALSADYDQVHSSTIYILCSIFTLISAVIYFIPIFFWLKE